MTSILIAQHNAATAAFLKTTLRKSAYSVMTVDNALDTWRIAGREEFDVILLDLHLPGIDAVILAQRALQANPTTQIVFINGFSALVMDTYATPSYAPAPVTLPAFHISQITSRLRALLNGQYDAARVPQAVDGKVIYPDFGARAPVAQQMQQ